MKKLMNIFVLVAAAAMALASCQKSEIKNPEPQSYEYTFLIGDADSKAVIGPNCIEWVSGDQMGVYTKVAAGTISNNAFGDITPGSPATMKVYSNQALAIGDYIYAYYPYSSANENQNLSVTMEIPAEQDGKDDMPMVAIPHRVESALNSGKQDAPAGKIKFANLGSVIEFNVYTETEEYASEVVTSVAFEADKALAGAFTFDLTNVNYSDASTLSITSELTEKEVVANVSDLAVGTKDEPAIVRMVVAPGSYTGNVVVTTDKATYTFPISTAKEFKRSAIKPLGLKLREDVREENAEPSSKTVTFDFTSTSELVNLGITLPSASAGTDISSMTLVKDEVSMTSTDGTSGTRIWNSSGEYDLRVYKSGGSVTFSVPNGNYISKIIFTGSSLAKLTSSSDTFSSGEWNGNSQTVTFSASERVDIKTVSITYSIGAGSGETPVEKNLESIVVVDPKVAYTVGEEFVEPKVKATYSDGTSAEVTGATFSGYDMSTAGTQTVTVSYTEGDVTEETSYEITVSEAVILVENGTYVIAVKEDNAYYAVSTDANGDRREAVELTGYSEEENYVSHDSKIVWTITNVSGGITVSSGESYWGAKKNGISLKESADASTITITKSGTEGTYLLSGDCGSDGIRYLAIYSLTNGFGFYAESNKDDIYLIPATFVELPTLGTPVVTAELNDTNDGINVSWESVTNAEKYLVVCGENSVEVTATEHEFTGLTPGEYSVTVTAVAENYNSATSEPVTVTVPSAEGTTEWVATSFADLKAGDQVVIVATKGTSTYALANDKGTSAAPEAVTGITYSNNKLTAEPAARIIWYVGVSGNDRIFYADAGQTKWLYCTSSNNGIRVGTNTANTFTWESDYMKHIGTSRYVGVYVDNPDWRCYTNTTGNIAGQTFLLFVKKDGSSGGETPSLSSRNLAFSAATATATVGEAFTAPVLSGVTDGVTYSSSNTAVATVDESTGAVTIVAAGTTTITASAPATAEYEAGTASYTLTVSEASGGTAAYVKVSDLSSLTTGQYIIAAKISSGYRAMSNTFASKISGTEVTVTDDKISESDGESYVVTITKSGSNYTIKSGTKFLTYSSSTNLGSSATSYDWTIKTGTNGTFRITSVAATSRGVVYRAGTYNQFGGYATSNVSASGTEYYDVELFKLTN